MSFAKLIEEVKKESPAAQKSLYKILVTRFFPLCVRYLKNIHDAEDVLQEGLVNIFKALNTYVYETEKQFYAWASTVLVNQCLKSLRKRNRFNKLEEIPEEDVAIETDGLENISRKEIQDLILLLPNCYRTIFNMHVIEGMEHKEIGWLLGISEVNSRTQVKRAKRLIRKLLLLKSIDYVTQR